ncbi:NAD(P)/FAD-dependent oxidoreductase [Geoalkalibacter halelectricus]|uniref:FAD-dependent oxidoreductase n=1 Tax=Geoalkalibacter halelectricus TaxID=2847045 RepID=A0ABY5ZIR3_9BACT|nr:FAD-dependent oxidoreductase [Geoalkalibacter halelectricus]MDO3378973.1 FAD-dependent oxidoreductase [Geoalkalibacter halelectricus]UWZ78789.1 FAD-dependent oxidoreductase [Geoalkalibacter halelectricus]
MNILVIGGGYAGLACLMALRRSFPATELHLFDSAPQHVQATRLHQTLRRPLSEITRPFADLAQQFGFTYHPQGVRFTAEDLCRWQETKTLEIDGACLEFDFLVIAAGARTRELPPGENVLIREDLARQDAGALLEQTLEDVKGRAAEVAVVGGGATGLQFLFELRQWGADHGRALNLRLIDLDSRLLSRLPEAFHRYLCRRLKAHAIAYHGATHYRGQRGGRIYLEPLDGGDPFDLPCDLVLGFPGVSAMPRLLETNRYGQVLADGLPLDCIFAAGDCSCYLSAGLNAQTAQAAMRKGALVADNILRATEGRRLAPYLHRELGYFISLGDRDGIGWLGLRANVLTGLGAFAVKEALEAQYDLFLRGINTYI